MSPKIFGKLKDGKPVYAYTLKNNLGMEVTLLNYGGIIQSIKIPVNGEARETVLGYDTLEDYLINPSYLGATIGRTAGRLQEGQLSLDGKVIAINDGSHHLLHGGPRGFHQKYMRVRELDLPKGKEIRLYFEVLEEEDQFPGNLEIEITYQLFQNENTLKVTYKGYSDKKTYLNLTNHSYFNLSENGEESVSKHRLRLNALSYATLDETMIPSQTWTKVHETAMDFTKMKSIGQALDSMESQIRMANGIDHPFLIEREGQVEDFVQAAQLEAPDKVLKLEVYSTQRHLVVYTGNYLQEANVPSGKVFQKNQGICFETQDKPNLVNSNPELCVWTEPGQPYQEVIKYVFSSKN